MMLYTKYKSSGPCSFGQEEFWNTISKTNFDPVTYLCNQLEWFNNFGRGPPKDHSCEGWSKSKEWFREKKFFEWKKLTNARSTDDEQRPVAIAQSDHFVHMLANNQN